MGHLTVRRMLQLFFFFGIFVISGALQRPIGGQVIEGSMSDAVTVESNSLMTFIGLFFYAWAGLLFVKLWPRTKPFFESYPLWILVALAILSALWSQDPILSATRGLGLLGCTLFAFTIIGYFKLDEILRLTGIFFVVLIVGTFLVLLLAPGYAVHGGDEFYSIHAGLLRGTYNHKNSLGRVLALGLIVLIFNPLKGRYWKLAGYFSVIVGLYLLMLTGSAKTFVSVPAAIVVALVFVRLRTLSVRLGFIGVVALIYGVLAISGYFSVIESMLLEGLDRDPNMSARTFIWAVAVDEGFKTPFVGSGFGGAGWKGDGVGSAMLAVLGFDPGHSHNGFIQTFVELGFLGLGVVFYFIARTTFGLMRISSGRDGACLKFFVGWWVLFIFNNYAGSFLVQPNDIYWFMLAITAYYIALMRNGAIRLK